jgi:phosphoglycolate phosphatase-like HAD superfamily hydrolase
VDLAGRSKIRWIMKPPFADSWVTFDRDGTLTELKKTDAALASAGREPVTEEEAKAIRRSLTERIRDIERFGNDRATTAILSHEAARKAVEAYYSRHRR